jgi:hypothetical protein
MAEKIVIPDIACKIWAEKYANRWPEPKKASCIPDYLDEEEIFLKYFVGDKNENNRN